MADQPIKKKRLVKNPETFRERAVKASERQDKPGRASRVRTLSGKLTGPVTRPIGRSGKRLAKLKIFRWLRKPLRLIGKVLFPSYFRNSWLELRLVSWPSRRQSRRLTVAVLIFAVAFGGTVAVVDFGLDKLFRHVLLK